MKGVQVRQGGFDIAWLGEGRLVRVVQVREGGGAEEKEGALHVFLSWSRCGSGGVVGGDGVVVAGDDGVVVGGGGVGSGGVVGGDDYFWRG